ncbi:TetR/AcrR family transcriptional regulator [Limibaculum sp. M0105]|uniref:TetR/AcrR family transcriptional regulator n=1 Tax=Thermohalobaculum xanthum TaxID=2753746 RepID=A0A8J7M871_9RHOB|nr:TetR/AcrR family transcriptional regulator [Thermohalobaculum xanthum]MBK0400043.1 TetR/AcrR family transcriptional regulator [Thermohalobaculum xanthum]
MTDTMTRIAAGLERAFAANGFAEPSVEDLRDAAGVSLRTLYKYAPSRDEMVRAALDHRHQRYMAHVFADLPQEHGAALGAIVDRIADWMAREASHGCLFHAAVAAAPRDAGLRALLARHKAEVAERAARASGLPGREVDLTLVIEGLTQSWPLHGDATAASARRLCDALRAMP